MTRRTKIVCTLGPASDSDATIEALLARRDGCRAAKLFARDTGDARRDARPAARRRRAIGTPAGGFARSAGAEDSHRRAGWRKADHAARRATSSLSRRARSKATAEGVSTTYAAFPLDVRPGDRILLSDGAIELRALEINGQDTLTEVVHGGVLAEHKGINLPGVAVCAPALTPKDRDDLAFGVRQGVDYIALSFVRKPEDLEEAKRLIAEQTPRARSRCRSSPSWRSRRRSSSWTRSWRRRTA